MEGAGQRRAEEKGSSERKERNEKEETQQRKCVPYDFLDPCLDPYDYKLFFFCERDDFRVFRVWIDPWNRRYRNYPVF